MAEVEVFSSRKLQRALTFTDAEVENEGVLANMGAEVGMSHLKIEQVSFLKLDKVWSDLTYATQEY